MMLTTTPLLLRLSTHQNHPYPHLSFENIDRFALHRLHRAQVRISSCKAKISRGLSSLLVESRSDFSAVSCSPVGDNETHAGKLPGVNGWPRPLARSSHISGRRSCSHNSSHSSSFAMRVSVFRESSGGSQTRSSFRPVIM